MASTSGPLDAADCGGPRHQSTAADEYGQVEGSSMRRRVARVVAHSLACALVVGALDVGTSPAPAVAGLARSAVPIGAPANWIPATIPDSAFPVPSDAVVVSTRGADTAPGTLTAPVRTIARGIALAAAGGTVVVRGGVYRETLGVLNRVVTIQAYPHEGVWIDGSVVVAGWAPSTPTPNGSTWAVGRWAPSLCRSCFPSASLDPAKPLAGLPDQVFYDGMPLGQVATPADVGPGTFAVDPTDQTLTIGTDPTGHRIEATAQERAVQFGPGSAGSMLRGVGIRRFGARATFDVPAAVISTAPGVVFDHVAIAWSASRGISVFAPANVVVDSTIVDNGMTGLHAHGADYLIVARNRIMRNNFEGWSIAPSATGQIAGLKVTLTGRASIVANIIEDNASNGLWVDVRSWIATIANNTVRRNAGHGIDVEISADVIVAGNAVTMNGRHGVKVAGSNRVAVWHNTAAANGWAQLGIFEDPRFYSAAPNGVTGDATHVVVANNVFAGRSASTHPLFESFDTTVPRHLLTSDMIDTDDSNAWIRPSSAGVPLVALWQTSLTGTARYKTLVAFRSAVGRELRSIAADDGASSGMFTDPQAGIWTPAPNSPLWATGMPTPPEILAALGVLAFQLHLGAIAPA